MVMVGFPPSTTLRKFADATLHKIPGEQRRRSIDSLESFLQFSGKDITLGELSLDLVDQWLAHESSAKHRPWSQKTIESRRWDILAILQEWNPKFGRRGRSRYSPNDTGSLGYIVIYQYLRSNVSITSNSTRNHYRAVVEQFDICLNRVAKPGDLTDENVAEYLAWLKRHPRKYSAETICQRLNYLRAAWRWLFAKGLVKVGPTIKNPPSPDPIPVAWTLDQFRQLIETARQATGELEGVPAAIYWESLLMFIYYYGERIGACLSAKWSDFDLETKTLIIRGQDRKGGVKAMTYHLIPQVLDLFERLKEPTRENLWPSKGSGSINYRFSCLVKRSGLPFVAGKSSFHKVRRTCASHLEAAGGDATAHLGHSRRSVTTKHYLDVRLAKGTNYALLLPDPTAKEEQ